MTAGTAGRASPTPGTTAAGQHAQGCLYGHSLWPRPRAAAQLLPGSTLTPSSHGPHDSLTPGHAWRYVTTQPGSAQHIWAVWQQPLPNAKQGTNHSLLLLSLRLRQGDCQLQLLLLLQSRLITLGGQLQAEGEEELSEETEAQGRVTRSAMGQCLPGTAVRGGWSGTRGAARRRQQIYPQLSCSQKEVTEQNERSFLCTGAPALHNTTAVTCSQERSPARPVQLGNPLSALQEDGSTPGIPPSILAVASKETPQRALTC